MKIRLENIINVSKDFFDNAKYLFKKQSLLLTTFTVLSGFYYCGCSSDESSSSPTGPSSPSGSSSGYTNSGGNVALVVNSNSFNVKIKDENGNSLQNINVKGQYNGSGKYEFLAKDFSDDYFCKTDYYPEGTNIEGATSIDINMWLSEVTSSGEDFKIENKKVPFNSPHSNLDFLGTVVLSDLWDFFQEHDSIVKNKSYLEFVANNSNQAWFTIALKAEEFRETFIEKTTNVSEIIDYVCGLFGLSYDSDAYYLDVYSNNLGVLTLFENEDDYCTVKGEVWDGYYGDMLSGVSISVYDGPSSVNGFTNSSGEYLLKFLLEGEYTFSYSLNNYGNEFRVRDINAPNPPLYSSSIVNATMYAESSGQDTLTITLQPGSEGIDTYISIWSGGSGGNETHGDEEYMKVGISGVTEWEGAYLKFDLSSISSSAEIFNAELVLSKNSIFSNKDFKFKLYTFMNSWSESTLCYNNAPSSYYFGSFTFSPPPGYDASFNFNITSLVQDWIDGVPNHGLKLKLQDGDSYEPYTYLISSDNDDASKRPKLTVEYILN